MRAYNSPVIASLSATCRTLEQADASGLEQRIHAFHETFLYVVRLVRERRKHLPTYTYPCIGQHNTTQAVSRLKETKSLA